MPKLCSERLLQIMEMSKFCSPTPYPDLVPAQPPLLTPQITQLLFYERTFNPGPDVTKPGSWRLLTQNTSLLLADTDTKQYV